MWAVVSAAATSWEGEMEACCSSCSRRPALVEGSLACCLFLGHVPRLLTAGCVAALCSQDLWFEKQFLLTTLLQEHKLQEVHVEDVVQQVGLEGWHLTFNCSTAKKGYSGTATLCRCAQGRARFAGVLLHENFQTQLAVCTALAK